MQNANISIDFRPAGAGWGELDIKIGQHSIRMASVSYTTDVLGDLLRVALMISTGAWTARASFDGEPREWRLVVGSDWDIQRWREGFWVRVLEFPDCYARLSDDKGDVTFEAECDKVDFARQILALAKRFSDAGPANYEWGNYQFPARALAALETALAVSDPPLNSPQTV